MIVSKETKVGGVGLYATPETKIMPNFLSANNLYREKTLNQDQKKSGFFESNGRVKTMKFRGNKSQGFFIALKSLDFLNISQKEMPVIGDSFDTLNKIPLCEKYVVKINNQPAQGGSNKKQKGLKKFESKIIDTQFRFHEKGVVVRIEGLGLEAYKLKSFGFNERGSKLADKMITNIEDNT